MRTLLPSHVPKVPQELEGGTGTLDKGHALKHLPVGQQVRVQDPVTGQWSFDGAVLKACGRNYLIRLPNGRVWWRNRRQLRPSIIPLGETETKGLDEAIPSPQPRRGTRPRQAPDRLGVK
jgi:hypothetical protein